MRIKSLDSLRGIAALLVVFHHCFLTIPAAQRQPIIDVAGLTPLRILLLGRPAVIFFFVLSGFVLAIPYLAGRELGYGQFILKRICRIYLPLVAAILLSAALYLAVTPAVVSGASGWFNDESWIEQPSVAVLLKHALMTGHADDARLDNVIWSLIYELRISLIFPLLTFVGRRRPVLAAFLALGIYAAVKPALNLLGIGPLPYYSGSLLAGIVITIHFVPCFLVGIAVASCMGAIRDLGDRLPRSAHALLWFSAVGALMIESDFVNTAGAALMIALALGSEKASRSLSRPGPIWLGRISYSLYLVHLPILLAVTHLLGDMLPIWTILALVPPLALLVAHLFHYFIEVPSMALGKRLTIGAAPTGPSAALSARPFALSQAKFARRNGASVDGECARRPRTDRRGVGLTDLGD